MVYTEYIIQYIDTYVYTFTSSIICNTTYVCIFKYVFKPSIQAFYILPNSITLSVIHLHTKMFAGLTH